MAGLEVQIGANNAELEAKIAESEKLLKKFEKQKEAKIKIGADTGDLDKKIKEANASLDKLKKTSESTGASFNKFNRSTADGSNTLTQFSRIAQDAPFGIIGIGNNITATAEAFGNLSRSSGGAGGALKAVASSIMGTGGILLAVSLVTTGLTIMAQKGLTVGDVFDKLTGNFNEARRAMQDLNAEAAKNAQAQISSVGAYVAAAKNINLSMADRLIAVKKLQDEYPAYFGNLTKEQILNGNVAGAVREVTAALINKAKAAAMVEKIVKLAEEEEKIQSRINNTILETAKSMKLNNTQAFELARLLNAAARSGEKWSEALGGTAFDNLSKFSVAQQISILRSLEGFNAIGNELRANLRDQDKLTKGIERTTAASIKLEDVKPKETKATKAKINIEAIPTLKPAQSTDEQLDKQLQIMRDRLSDDLTRLKTVPIVLNIPTQITTDTRAASRALEPYYKMFFEFTKNVDELVTTSISSTFENLGASIGEAIASGQSVFKAVGNSLLASIGAFISELGGLLIKYGTLAVAKGVIDKALSSGNPIVTIGAGVAAIAVGVALKGVGASISSRASAGTATGSGSTGASYSSPGSSAIAGGTSSSTSNTVVFEISGNSLIGVLGNALESNKRLGGLSGI